jgi:DNA primase
MMNSAMDYMTFAVNALSEKIDTHSPAGKNELVQILTKQIRAWNHPLMVHESLRKLAHLVKVPEEIVGVGQDHVPNIYIKKSDSMANFGLQTIDPDRILESDFLRWLLLMGQEQATFIETAKKNLKSEDLRALVCRQVYQAYLECHEEQKGGDLLSLAIKLEDTDGQLLMTELLQKKVNADRAEQNFHETIQKILDRNWMLKREEIKMRIQSGQCSDDEALELTKVFAELNRSSPKMV